MTNNKDDLLERAKKFLLETDKVIDQVHEHIVANEPLWGPEKLKQYREDAARFFAERSEARREIEGEKDD